MKICHPKFTILNTYLYFVGTSVLLLKSLSDDIYATFQHHCHKMLNDKFNNHFEFTNKYLS